MTIELYVNNSDANHINKTITLVSTLTGNLRENTDLINPKLDIEGDDVLSANYMYIQELGRYYFINNVEWVSGEIFRISAHIDVLMTYANEIKAQNAIIKRQQYDYNVNLIDDRLKTTKDPYIQTINFPQGFSQLDWTYVLIMGGNGFKIDTTAPTP